LAQFCFIPTNRWIVFGGSEILWTRTAENLARREHRVHADLPEKQMSGPHVARLRQAGVTISVQRRKPRRGLARRLLGDGLPREAGSADLVILSQAHCYDGAGWAARLCSIEGRYCLISQAGGDHLQPDDTDTDEAIAAHDGAAASFFVSRGTLELARRQLASDLPTGRIARNPVQVDANLGPLPWPKGTTLRLASVARLDAFPKGHDLVLEVLARRRWRARDLTLDLIGAGNNERMLRRQIERLDLDSVRLPGSSGDIADVWRNHHGLLLGSRVEGLPLALAEAMLMGRVPVVTDVAGNAELVDDGRTGFLAAAPTVDHIDEALERAWDRRREWPKIGRTAAETAARILPSDPVGDFADQLLKLADAG
jgi:glycosyltransferase involved in cell wall biosynthesis